jgi:polyisoprenoid-binding protein YceI
MRLRIMGWKQWLIVSALGVVLLVVGGPFIYFRYVQGDAPAPLTLPTPAPEDPGEPASGSVAGTWKVTDGSQVGYRVKEVLFGQSGEAVGRTDSIQGSVTIEGTMVTSATFTVDMASVTSNESRRDEQFRGRIMQTSTYPTGTFALSQPIALTSIPADGVATTARATGKLTFHGVTQTVTFDLTGRRDEDRIQISGSIPITFTDYNIANPSFGPAQTEDSGVLEFLLALTRT